MVIVKSVVKRSLIRLKIEVKIMEFGYLDPGKIVYDVLKASNIIVIPVKIVSRDENSRNVVASWNYGKPQCFVEAQWSKWLLSNPMIWKEI
jgi:hypothetical protein